MASRFWVGGTATWDAAAGAKWAATSGGAGGQAVPTAADDVVLDAASGAAVVTTTSASVCRSLNCTGFTGTLSLANNAAALLVGDASGGAFTLSTTMTLTVGGTSTIITFVSTSTNGGTGWGITTGGRVLPATTFNGSGGKWVLQDAFSCGTNTLTLTIGTLDTNSKAVTCSSFSSNNTNTRTITLGTSSITCTASGATIPWNVGNPAGLTLSAASSTITCNGAFSGSTTFTGIQQSYGTVIISGSGPALIGVGLAPTFVNFTRTGTALKSDSISFGFGITVTGTLTLGGNTTQGVNRMLVGSNVIGTQRTITMTGAAVVINGDVDFKDLAITGAPSWTNSGNAFVGDCLGNGTLITTNRTTPAAQTYNGTASDNWSTLARWTSRVPLPQDNVTVVAITAGAVTADMPRLGADIDFTGSTRSVTFSSVANESYGSWKFASGMIAPSGTQTLTLAGRGSQIVTSNGQTWTVPIIINAPNGTYTLQDTFTDNRSPASALTVSAGTFTDNGQTINITGVNANFAMIGGTSNLTGTWNISQATAGTNVWNVTGGILNASTVTINVIATCTGTRTFVGGSNTYGTLTHTVAGSTGQLTVTGDNTFGTINFSDVTNARTLALPTATSTTITTLFNVNGTAGKLMSVTGDVDSTVAQACNYLSLSSSDATGGPWYASLSTDGGSNTGWIISTAAVVGAAFAAPLGGLTTTIAATVEHPATLAAPLGGLSASLAATPNHPAVLAAPLGSLVTSITATVEHPANFSAPLGELSANITAVVEHPATFSAPLGSLVATTPFDVIHQAALDTQLGALVVSVSATPNHPATLAAPLNALSASLAAIPDPLPVLNASLGGLSAALTAIVEHSTILNAPLGELLAPSIAANVEHASTFSAPLSGLVATAAFDVTKQAIFDAQLGSIVATISSTVGHHPTLQTALGALAATISADTTHPAIFDAPLGPLVTSFVPTIRPIRQYFTIGTATDHVNGNPQSRSNTRPITVTVTSRKTT